MAHLGDDVAAFVDGQLSDPAMLEASAHLRTCEVCEKAVRQQRLLKSRMSTVATPGPPAALLASLAGLASEPPVRESWWVRLGRSVPFRAGVVLVSASMAVIATAYAVGGVSDRIGDQVAPPYNRYAADFVSPPAIQASAMITESAMADLDEYGWACHPVLAGDLQRVSATYVGDDDVISLDYRNGLSRLHLFEQNGVLDPAGLDGFTAQTLGGSDVWVRDGSPTVVTWDDDGTVYTIVSDLGRARIAQAVADLPRGEPDKGMGQRVGDGLSRMSAWIGAA